MIRSATQGKKPALTRAFSGGGERIRTADFYVANVALCQLSYTPGKGVMVPGPAKRAPARQLAERRSRSWGWGLETVGRKRTLSSRSVARLRTRTRRAT